MATASGSQLDISHLDPAVQFFCKKGIADSTHKTYQSALRRFGTFCSSYGILSPFPVSEALLCYFAAAMGCERLAPQTIKTYLSAIRYMQIVLGLPEPKQFSSLPRLHLVQMGIKRNHSQHRPLSTKVRLPITPAILRRIKALWSTKATDHNKIMLWVAACLCFFGFFRAGEITIPTEKAFDPKTHLSWGDIAVDDITRPSVLQVSLKRSECDQFGQGVKVYIGQTGDMLCPVAAVLSFMASRGSGEGPFFSLLQWSTSYQREIYRPYSTSPAWPGSSIPGLRWTQFPHRSCHCCSKCRNRRLYYSYIRPLEQQCIPRLHSNTQRETSAINTDHCKLLVIASPSACYFTLPFCLDRDIVNNST